MTEQVIASYSLCSFLQASLAFSSSELTMNRNDDDEKWKDIPGLEGCYQASNKGRIRSKLKWPYHIIRPVEETGQTKHYYRFTVRIRGVDKGARSYARMVALTWLGSPPEPAMKVMFKNGVRDDFRPENLYWAFWADEREKIAIEKYGLSRRSCVYCDAALPAYRPKNRMCSKCTREYRRAKDMGKHREWCEAKVGMKAETRTYGLGYPPSKLDIIIKYLRKPSWSMQDGAVRAGVTPQTFSRWVNNYRRAKGLPVPKVRGPECKQRRIMKAKRLRSEKRIYATDEIRREAALFAVENNAKAAAEKYKTTTRSIVRWKKKFGLSGKIAFDK